jgi:hypothetical protein
MKHTGSFQSKLKTKLFAHFVGFAVAVRSDTLSNRRHTEEDCGEDYGEQYRDSDNENIPKGVEERL